jgi:riboflavin kinase/FMN adenylyltransferase
MAFDPHPATILSTPPPRLTSWYTRERLLRDAGADRVVRIEPSTELLALDPVAFVEERLLPLAPADVVEGPDFRFGRARAGDTGVLAVIGRAHGFRVHVVEAVTVPLDNLISPVVSSTLTRWLLTHGRVRDAAILLGRPHRVEGSVVRGDRLGRTIGIPTANLEPETMPPGDGVYAAEALLPTGERVLAAVSVGARPTVQGRTPRVEAHLLGVTADPATGAIRGLPEYGWRLSLEVFSRVRDHARFESLDHLRSQIARDVAWIESNRTIGARS